MTPENSRAIRNHGLNALVGYSVGSLLYFVFLWMAVLCGHYGLFRSTPDPMPAQFQITCTLGSLPPFWYRAVSLAALNHHLQPTTLYLAALLVAGLFATIRRPLAPDRLPGIRGKLVAAGLFGSAALMNLWFSLSNLGPRFWFWRG